ncbi:MAG: 1-(5-phosphoribosyl)-5-[Solobacterium sp.]|nr:1-(5-phosphoribosyl)-5-[(5-phosphoribosylamino)methylideneamino]imidazole-4-carboxamide isomerase [Solobacterium sp.]
MKIWPAVDLSGGKAVRLVQGDYAQKTVYSDDPLTQALVFKEAGAEYLHVVDLDGAKSGLPEQFDTVRRIIENSGLKTENGGGIRTLETAEKYLACGAYRVILGTAAAEDPGLLAEAGKYFGDRIAVGADIRDGIVRTRGWLAGDGLTLDELCERTLNAGIHGLICTDISKDGMFAGTNLILYRELCERYPGLQITASGGISTMQDIAQLTLIGLDGVIIGKALYTGNLSLAEILQRCSI